MSDSFARRLVLIKQGEGGQDRSDKIASFSPEILDNLQIFAILYGIVSN